MELSLTSWIAIGGYMLVAVVYVVQLIIKIVKGKKETNTKVDVVLNGIQDILNNFLPIAIIDAESTGMTGVAKKMYVISKCIIECGKKGLSYEDNAQLIDDAIEKLVDMTKHVNTGEIKNVRR